MHLLRPSFLTHCLCAATLNACLNILYLKVKRDDIDERITSVEPNLQLHMRCFQISKQMFTIFHWKVCSFYSGGSNARMSIERKDPGTHVEMFMVPSMVPSLS